jgi:uncharacterized protein (TIGR02611 family)
MTVERPDDSEGRHEGHTRRQEFAKAALEAELKTGTREGTLEEARAHIAVRIVRISAGVLVTVIGIALLPLPGPGWLVIAAGLVILAQDFAWAERTLAIVRRRLPQDADGKIPTRTWVIIGLTTTATVAVSLWWSLLR